MSAAYILLAILIFGTNGSRYVRISLCAKEEKISEALQRIQHMQAR